MLADGRLDAVMSARQPSCFVQGTSRVPRLFPDYRTAEREYYGEIEAVPDHARRRRPARRPGKNRWLAASVYKAFPQAKRMADAESRKRRR